MSLFSRVAFLVFSVLAMAGSAQEAAAQDPTFAYEFNPATVNVDETAFLEFLVDATAAEDTTGLGFTLNLPTTPGLMLIASDGVADNCGPATLTATSGGSSITLSGGTVQRGAICTITVPVKVDTAGTYAPGAVTLNFAGGSAVAASSSLTAVAAGTLDVTKSLSVSSISIGDVSRVTYVLTTTASLELSIQFDETLPSGVSLATPVDTAASCSTGSNPTVTAADGGSSVSVLVSSLSAGQTCTISFDVLGLSEGTFLLASSAITTSSRTYGGETESLTVNAPVAGEPQISKSFQPSTADPGETVDLTFTISNPNRSQAMTDIAFTDDLDTMLTGAVATGLPSTDACGTGSSVSGSGTLSLTGGSLSPGGTCAFTVQVGIPAGASPGRYTNVTSAVTGSLGGGSPAGSDTARAEINVQAAQALTLTRAFNPLAASSGAPVLLSHTITNPNSGSAASAITLVEDLSGILESATYSYPSDPCGAGSSLANSSFGSSNVGFTLSGGSLAASDSCTFDVTVNIPDDSPGGTFTDTSSAVTATINGETVTSDTTTSTITINGGASLSLVKEFEDTQDGANDGSVANGGLLDMVLTLTSTPESTTATAISFTDDLNAFSTGTTGTILSDSCGGATMSTGDSLLVVTGASLNPGLSCSVTLRLTIAGAANAETTNTTSAVSFDAGGTTGSAPAASDSIFLGDNGKAVVLTHVYSPNPAVAGEAITVAYTLSNPNTSDDATSIVFTHDLGNTLTGLAPTGSDFTACNGGSVLLSGDTVILTGGSLNAGLTCDFTVNALVPGGASTGQYSSATSGPSATVGGSSVSGTPSSATFSINNEPLLFSKQFENDPILPGGTSNLTFTLENTLGTALSGVTFTDQLTTMLPGSTFGTADINTCGGTNVGSGSLLDYQGGMLAAGDTCTIRLPVTVPVDAGNGTYTNTTSTLSAAAGARTVGADPASDTLTVSGTADAALSVVFSNGGEVRRGGTISAQYTIDAPAGTNLGGLGFTHDYGTDIAGMVATNLPLTDPCGAGSSASGSGTLLLSGGSVPAGGSCTFTVQLSVPLGASEGPVASDTSQLTTNGLVTAAAASDTITVTPAADLAVTASDGATSVNAGASTTYSVVARNDGPSDDSAAQVTITTPTQASCTYTATAAGGATLTSASGSGDLSENVSLPSGGSIAYAVECTVAASATGTLSLAASIAPSAGVTELASANNSATDNDTVIVPTVPVAFAKAFADPTINQGGTTTLTLSIDNAANHVPATSLAFTDTFPAGLVVANPAALSNTCGGTVTAAAGSGSVVLNGGSVAALADCAITLSVRATGSGTLVNVTGDLTSSLGNSGTATDSLAVSAAPVPVFAKNFADANIVQGGVTTLTFSINNSTALVEANTIAFGDTFPSGMTVATVPNISDTCSGTLSGATAGAGSITYSGGLLAAGDNCEVSLDVTATDLGTATNVSDTLTSNLGNSGTATDTLEVTSAPVPGFAKGFSDASIVQGAVTTLTFTIDNTAGLIAADDIAFGDTFPSGMTVAAAPNTSDTCNGVLSAPSGATAISYSDGDLASGASCTVSVDVTSVQSGTNNNVSDALTSSLGNSGTANAAIQVNAADTPGFAKSFAPASIPQGGVSTLTLVIDNSTSLVEATDLAFVDTFPAGLTVAATSNAATTCTGGSVSTGASSVTLATGTVAPGATCNVTVDVSSAVAGTVSSTSGTLTSSLGDSGTATASLTVTPASAPTIAYAFSPLQIPQGGTSGLIITIDNRTNLIGAGPIGVSGTLPANLRISGPASTTCGGTLTATIGSRDLTVTNGSVPAQSTCIVTIPVSSDTIGASGDVNLSLTSPFGNATGTGSGAPLVVVPNPEGTVTIIQNSNVDATFGFSSDASALNFSISTVGGTGRAGPITLTAGTYVLRQSRPTGSGNQSLSCSDADSTVDAASGTVTIQLDGFENLTCTFSSVNSGTVAADAISNFMQRRNNLILSHGPSRGRRLDRLNRGIGTSQTLSFQRGDIASFAPVGFNLMSLGSGSYNISTSLRQVEEAALKFRLGNDLDPESTAILENRRFDVWFEAHYAKFNASQGSGGDFGIAYLGADYLFTNDLLAGVMLQYDMLEDLNTTTGTLVEGNGWMVGPYVTTRLAPNLILDARLAYGKSSNDFSTPLSSGSFPTDRWLVDVNFSGDFDHGNWVISPNLNISYIEDKKPQTVDSLNAIVPGFTESLGQISFGPTFSSSYTRYNTLQVQQTYSINGIYNFADSNRNATTSAAADETDGLRGRVEAGWRITNRHGTTFDLALNYDGIGKSDYEAYGVKFGMRIPLQ